MRFSIVIPTYNNFPELRKCLDALGKIQRTDFEVLVCIDGSTDDTKRGLEKIKTTFPMGVLIHSDGKNHGRSAARNLGLERISGEYVLFLDSDMRPRPDFLEKHEKILQRGNTVSLGAVKYLNEKSSIWARYISTRGFQKYKNGAEVPSRYFITQNVAMPSVFFKSLVGFDENISRYGGEDMEFGHRIMMQFQPSFVSNEDAIAETIEEKSLRDALAQLQEYGATGLPYIIGKFPEFQNVYHLDKIDSGKILDSLFGLLSRRFFSVLSGLLSSLLPFPLKKYLINHMVICAIHSGYRGKMKFGSNSGIL